MFAVYGCVLDGIGTVSGNISNRRTASRLALDVYYMDASLLWSEQNSNWVGAVPGNNREHLPTPITDWWSLFPSLARLYDYLWNKVQTGSVSDRAQFAHLPMAKGPLQLVAPISWIFRLFFVSKKIKTTWKFVVRKLKWIGRIPIMYFSELITKDFVFIISVGWLKDEVLGLLVFLVFLNYYSCIIILYCRAFTANIVKSPSIDKQTDKLTNVDSSAMKSTTPKTLTDWSVGW